MQETDIAVSHFILSHDAEGKMELKSKIPLSNPLFSPSTFSSAMALVQEAMTPLLCLRKEKTANTPCWNLLLRVLAPELTVVHLLLLLVCSGG